MIHKKVGNMGGGLVGKASETGYPDGPTERNSLTRNGGSRERGLSEKFGRLKGRKLGTCNGAYTGSGGRARAGEKFRTLLQGNGGLTVKNPPIPWIRGLRSKKWGFERYTDFNETVK